jgi:hypothetical protein
MLIFEVDVSIRWKDEQETEEQLTRWIYIIKEDGTKRNTDRAVIVRILRNLDMEITNTKEVETFIYFKREIREKN